MYTYRYGGKQGEARILMVADDQVAIRTHGIADLADAVQDEESRQLLDQLSPVAEFPEANVFVAQVQTTSENQVSLRDTVRQTLSQEEGIRFAGRVLHDPETGTPVVYTENFFVKFNAGVSSTQCLAILQKYGLTVKEALSYSENAYFVAAPEGSGAETIFRIAQELLDEPAIELCHPELISPVGRRGIGPGQWHLAPMPIGGAYIDAHANAEVAWGTSRGEGVTIAIIDDGVDIDHEEFSGDGKVVHPRDVTLQIDDPRPKINHPPAWADNHGTACAGVACAAGGFQASGVAPAAQLMPIRLRSGLGSRAEAEAFVWAADHGADVISCSWGPPDGEWWNPADARHHQRVDLPDMTREAIDYALTHGRDGKGCVIVWAAGNGNESVDNDGYASYSPLIAVAACNDRNRRSVYSDYGNAIWCCFPSGDAAWPPHHPTPQTPGIWTTDRSGRSGYNPGALNLAATPPGDDHGHYTDSFGGTSSACPGVAGVVALMLAVNPELHHREVKEILRLATARIDAAGGSYSADGHSPFYGYGRVDAGLAVELVQSLAAQSVQMSAGEPVFDALTLVVAPTPGATAAEVARRVAIAVLGKTTWKLKPVPHTPNTFDAFYTGRARISQGKVWDWVYALRAHRDVLYSEPSFIVTLPDTVEGDVQRALGLEGAHLPGTARDFFWNLRMVRAQDAWALNPPAGKSQGEGIRIAHPDSGYLEHPELDPSRILLHLAKDFVDGDADPKNDGGSHGLGTASVILSGDNPAGLHPVVTGAAPRASLIPLRVTKPRAIIPAPVLFEAGMRNLRDAVSHAVATDCHIISMSLGGPFGFFFLQNAIRSAVEQGLIVLAAAGNVWPWVAWPAAFPEVIAVAACNIERKPWRFSASGRAVVITAPGESVWKAAFLNDGTPTVVRDHGTSFAVATVAGIAALWLAYHGRDNLIARYGKPGIAPVFKEILLAYGAEPSSHLPPGDFGAGIINAVKVLEAPLPSTAPARGMRGLVNGAISAPDDKFALLAALFEGAPIAALRQGLITILDTDESGLPETLAAIGDELAFRLMTDAQLRSDFVAVLAHSGPARRAAYNVPIPTIEVPAFMPSDVRRLRQQLNTSVSSTRMTQQVR